MEDKDYEKPNGPKNEGEDEDDDFGLSEIKYEPAAKKERIEPEEVEKQNEEEEIHQTTYSSDKEETQYVEKPVAKNFSAEQKPVDNKSTNKLPVIIGLMIALILGGVAVYFLLFQEPEQPTIVEEAPIAEPIVEETPVEEVPEYVEPTPTVGEVYTVTSRTGRSYIIAASFFDEDNAKDYSNKLAQQGVTNTIIHPYGTSRFYRVAIDHYTSFAEANQRVEEIKSQGKYGDQLWVLKF